MAISLGPVVHFKSCEETLVLAAAFAAAALTYELSDGMALISALNGVIAGIVVVRLTYFEFTLHNNVISYRTRYRGPSYPLAWAGKVEMHTVWFGLPGHTFRFFMRSPPAPFNSFSLRTGLVSWPSGRAWVAAVNSAIQADKSRDPELATQLIRSP
jgi:hypothetical protein